MKKNIKRKIPIILLVLEIFIFCLYVYFGPEGLLNLKNINHQISSLESEIDLIAKDNTHLKQKIVQWHSSAFYKEKIAREQLQMARADEYIYFTS